MRNRLFSFYSRVVCKDLISSYRSRVQLKGLSVQKPVYKVCSESFFSSLFFSEIFCTQRPRFFFSSKDSASLKVRKKTLVAFGFLLSQQSSFSFLSKLLCSCFSNPGGLYMIKQNTSNFSFSCDDPSFLFEFDLESRYGGNDFSIAFTFRCSFSKAFGCVKQESLFFFRSFRLGF